MILRVEASLQVLINKLVSDQADDEDAFASYLKEQEMIRRTGIDGTTQNDHNESGTGLLNNRSYFKTFNQASYKYPKQDLNSSSQNFESSKEWFGEGGEPEEESKSLSYSSRSHQDPAIYEDDEENKAQPADEHQIQVRGQNLIS